MKKLVKVTKKNIKNGKCGRTDICPVALALKDVGYVSPKVYGWAIFCGTMNSIVPPRSVQRFIRNFDGNKAVKPFNFYLDI